MAKAREEAAAIIKAAEDNKRKVDLEYLTASEQQDRNWTAAVRWLGGTGAQGARVAEGRIV